MKFLFISVFTIYIFTLNYEILSVVSTEQTGPCSIVKHDNESYVQTFYKEHKVYSQIGYVSNELKSYFREFQQFFINILNEVDEYYENSDVSQF